jgi:hypothetical protein
VCLWSPLVAVGAAPLFLVGAIRHGWRNAISPANAASLVIAVPVVLYLTAGSGELPHLPAWNQPEFSLVRLVVFWLCEFVVLFMLSANAAPSRLMGITLLAMLLALPLYKFGAVGDLTMRASGPPLAILALMACRTMLEGGQGRALAVAALLGMGFVGQSGELLRGFQMPRVEGATIHFHEAMEQLSEFRNQYLAPVDETPTLRWVFR